MLFPLGLVLATSVAFVPRLHHHHRSKSSQTLHSTLDNDNDDDSIGIGIDLGTTRSAVAIWNGTHAHLLELDGKKTVASIVDMKKDEILIGKDSPTAYKHVKRILGTGGKLETSVKTAVPHLLASTTGKTYKKDSLVNQLHDAEHHPTMLKDSHGNPVHPVNITSHLVHYLIAQAQAQTHKRVSRVVVGVPAYFTDAQREATRQCFGNDTKVKVLNEPEAAALCYQDEFSSREEWVLVFDWGGGTFDTSILSVAADGLTQIVATSGNCVLGGTDLDGCIVREWQKLLSREIDRDCLYALAEQVRIKLSNAKQVVVELPKNTDEWSLDMNHCILPKTAWEGDVKQVFMENATHIVHRFARSQLEDWCHEPLQKLLTPVRQVALLAGAHLPGDAGTATTKPKSRKEARQAAAQQRQVRAANKQLGGGKVATQGGRLLDKVVLVGGTTRMPAVHRLLETLTGVRPRWTVHPDTAVALGCASYVGVLDGTTGSMVLNPLQAALVEALAKQKIQQEREQERADAQDEDEEKDDDWDDYDFEEVDLSLFEVDDMEYQED